MEKLIYTWEQQIDDTNLICAKIEADGFKPDVIVGISRGGLIPSRLLADSLGIEKIFVDQDVVSSDSLFVDDIFDSGKTFSDVLSKTTDSSKLTFATLFARRGVSYPEQLIYGEQTLDDSYLVFPWDKLEYEKSLK